MTTSTLADNVYQAKLANEIAGSKSIYQSQFDKVLARASKRSPVKQINELTQYAELERQKLDAIKSGDIEKQNEIHHKLRALETIERLVKTPNDLVVVYTEATFETVYNGQPKDKKVLFQTLRPLWLGWRQRLSFKNQPDCGFGSVEETQNTLDYISQVLVEDILLQVQKWKDNAPVGLQHYDNKKEKKVFSAEPTPYRIWLKNAYNNAGVDYFPAKLQLIQNLAEGKFDEAFDGIDLQSLTESEREQIVTKLKPKGKEK